jgi:copper resistance protein B
VTTVSTARPQTVATRHPRLAWLVLLTALGVLTAGGRAPPARAQEATGADPRSDHGTTGSDPLSPNGDGAGAVRGLGHDDGVGVRAAPGSSARGDARDPHAYSDGYDFGPYRLHMADTHSLAALLVKRFETVRSDSSSFTAYDLQAWYGRSHDRAVLKAEGDIDSNRIVDARSELLWGHAVAAFWDAQLGVRHDSGEGPNRDWLVFGVQGLAPYWVEVDLTGYLREQGRTAVRLETEYELLLTQKLIAQPRVEASAYGKSDPERGVGRGLSEVTAGLRLRYEIRREFAPYVGVEWARRFGDTQDLAKDGGEDVSATRLVAGVRFWF